SDAGPALACRRTHDHLLLLSSTISAVALEERLTTVPRDKTVVQRDVTSAHAGMYLLGPHLEDVLRHVTSLDVHETALLPGSCAETNLAGVQALLVRPPGLSLPALRVYVSWDLGEYVWETLLNAGASWGITPLGSESLQLLRLDVPTNG